MNHSPSKRPVLPGSTPSPGPMGLKSVYSTNAPAHLETHHQTHNVYAPHTNTTALQALHEKTMNKIVTKLPYQLRESVTAVLSMATAAAINMQTDLDTAYHEISTLRNEVTEKSLESQTLQKTCNLYKARLHTLEGNVESLQDNINSRQKYSIKNKSAISRLSSTNRMLIDALDAIQNTTNTGALMNSKSEGNLDAGIKKSAKENSERPPLLVPVSKNKATKGTHHLDYEETEKKVSMFQNDKLRESLLRVSREHYRSRKNSELLEGKVLELRARLRTQEQHNRKLKSELDEVKILLNVDAHQAEDTKQSGADLTGSAARKYHFGALDERFQGYLEKNAFDPIDGIQLLRRILAHMATAPTNLNIQAMVNHIASRDTQKIFECDMICLFVQDPIRKNVLLRYTVKSAMPEEIDISESKCIAAEVIRQKKVSRLNVLSSSTAFNLMIDTCTGVVAKRILSLPIYDADSSRVFACVHIINKNRNDLFSESDEVFGLLFADQASLLLTSCLRYDSILHHADMLQQLLEAATSVFSVIPDPDSLISSRPLDTASILGTLELISRQILKSPNVKAFLVSDYCGLEPGQLVMLESKNRSPTLGIIPTATMPLHSGIAGHVIETRSIYRLEDDGFDPYINPLVDLDPVGLPLITVPIMDLYGTVVGCLELVVGPRSPPLRTSEDMTQQPHGLLFLPAAQWLTHQISAPIQYLIKSIGSTVQRPLSTPSNIAMKGGMKGDFFSAGLERFNSSTLEADDTFTSLPVLPAPASAGGGSSSKMRSSSMDGTSAPLQLPPVEGATSKPTSAKVKFSDQQKIEDQQKLLDELRKEHEQSLTDLKESQHEVSELHGHLAEEEATVKRLTSEQEASGIKMSELEVEIKRLNQLVAAQESNEDTTAILNATLAKQAESEALAKTLEDDIASLKESKQKTESELKSSQELATALQQQIDVQTASMAAMKASQDSMAAEGTAAAHDVEEKLKSATELNEQQAQNIEEWKQSYEDMEKSYNEYKTYSETQQTENEQLRAHADELTAQMVPLQEQVTQLEADKTSATSEQEELKAQIEALKKTIEQKDAVQAILQQQVVKLAGQNIKEIDDAMTTGQSQKATVPPAVVAADGAGGEGATSSSPPAAAVVGAEGEGGVSEPPSPSKEAPHPPPMSRAPSSTSNRPPPSMGSRAPSMRPVSSTAAGAAAATGAESVGADTGDGIAAAATGGAWTVHVDEYERTYYYNEATGESSWSNPELPPEQRGEWLQHFDDSGQAYWIHQVSGESAWEVTPEGEAVVDDGVMAAAAAAGDEESVGSGGVGGGGGGGGGIFDTQQSQYSATAGDYTIEL